MTPKAAPLESVGRKVRRYLPILFAVIVASGCGRHPDLGAFGGAARRAERLTLAVAEVVGGVRTFDVDPRSHTYLCGGVEHVAAGSELEMPQGFAVPDSLDRVTALLAAEGFSVHANPNPDDPSGVSLDTNLTGDVSGSVYVSDTTVEIRFTTKCFRNH